MLATKNCANLIFIMEANIVIDIGMCKNFHDSVLVLYSCNTNSGFYHFLPQSGIHFHNLQQMG